MGNRKSKIVIALLLVLGLGIVCFARTLGSSRDPYAVRGAAPSPRLTRIGAIKHIEDFSDTTFGSGHWVSNEGTPTLSSDTTNYQATDGTTVAGTKMQTLASGTSATMYKVWSPAKNVNNCHLVFNVYVHEGSGNSSWTNITSLYIYLKDSNDVVVIYHLVTSAASSGFTGGPLVPGWLSLSVPLVSSKGSMNLANITTITVNINKVEGTTPAVTCGRLMFYTQPTTPGIVCFGFDGSYVKQKRAAMYLNSKGMVGTFYASKPNTGNGSGYMTMADLHQLKSAGHLVAMYPNQDGINWQNKTLEQKKSCLRVNGKWLTDNGFGNGAKIVSTPGYGCNRDDYDLMMGGFLDVLTNFGYGWYYPLTFYNLSFQPYSLGTNGTNHSAVLTAAAADHGIAVFVFHQCDDQGAGDVNYPYFKSVVDAAKVLVDEGKLVVRTPSDIINGNWGETPESDPCSVTANSRVSTQFDKYNDTNLANIPGLSVTLDAGQTYTFEVTLFISSGTGTADKCAVSTSNTLTATSIVYDVGTNSAAGHYALTRATALGTSVALATLATVNASIKGTITVNAGGTLTVQFAQNMATAYTSSVLVGSYMTVRK